MYEIASFWSTELTLGFLQVIDDPNQEAYGKSSISLLTLVKKNAVAL
jgi:hypothetical protein